MDYSEERKRIEEQKKQDALTFALTMGDAMGKRARNQTSRMNVDHKEPKNRSSLYYDQLTNNALNINVRSTKVW